MSTRRLGPVLVAWLASAGCGIVLDTAPSDGADAGGDATTVRPPVEGGPAELHDAAVDAAPDADAATDAAIDAEVLDADTDDAAPDVYVPPVIVSMAPLAPTDRVHPGDGAISSDGTSDGAFQVVVRGPIVAFALLQTNAQGMPVANEQWDTYVGDDVPPGGLAPSIAHGSDSYQLGVLDGGTLVNDAAGRCAIADPSERTLQIYAADVGSFVSGKSFRLWVEAPTHELIAGPVLTLP